MIRILVLGFVVMAGCRVTASGQPMVDGSAVGTGGGRAAAGDASDADGRGGGDALPPTTDALPPPSDALPPTTDALPPPGDALTPPTDAATAADRGGAMEGGVDRPPVADGGPVDRLSAGDGPAGDAANVACPFRFCEGFEGVALGAPPDPKVWTRAGNIVVETPPGRAGKAMHVRAGRTPTETYISQTTILPSLGNAFYGRVFLYIAGRPADFFHWSFTEVRGADTQGASVRYGGISTGNCTMPGVFCRDSFLFQLKPLVYGADEGASVDDDFPDPVIGEKTWHCIEWYMSSTTRESRLWWNGQERPKMHYTNAKAIPFPTFTRLYLGWALYQTGATTDWDVWFDDLAVNDQRIGCDP